MGRVFYFCFDHERPLGGPKQIYRHVDILTAAGIDAFVVHRKRRTPLGWFSHQARVLNQATFRKRFDPATDFAVLPEDLATLPEGQAVLDAPGRKVLFNQNVYLGFAAMGAKVPTPYPYVHPNVVATFAVSEHNRVLLQQAFPTANVLRVRNGVDPRTFRFRALQRKKPLIVCAAKAQTQLFTLYHLIRAGAAARGEALARYQWVLLQGYAEQEVAELLGRATFLVFLSAEEGQGLLALEAMLSGALVVAWDHTATAAELPAGYRRRPLDLTDVARWMARAASDLEAGTFARLERLQQSALRKALASSPDAEARSVLAAWRGLLTD